MTAVHLHAMGAWFPDETVAVATLPELPELPAAQRKVLAGVGVDEIRDAGELTEVDIAERAALRTLSESGVAAGDLDALILVTGRAPDYLMSSEATRLQRRLGAHRAMTMSVGDLGCVSVSAALSVAAGLLTAHQDWRHVLVAMGAKAPTKQRFRPPMTVLGDGGMAVLLGPGGPGSYWLLDLVLASDGRYSDLFRIRYRDSIAGDWMEECADPGEYSFALAVDSRNRFRQLNKELLARLDVPAGALGGHVMQNLSTGAYRFWQEALGVEFLPACERNLRRYGHLGSMDVLLNLHSAARELAKGQRVLVMNSSPVAAWSSAVFERL